MSINSSQSILEVNNNNNNNLNNTSLQLNTQSLSHIFGPFFRSTKFFTKDAEFAKNKFKRIILLLFLILFILRIIYYIIELFRTQNLTLTWARTSLQLTFTLNALSCFGWLYRYGNNYFNKFIFGLQNVYNKNGNYFQQQQSHQLIPSFIRPFIFSFIFIFTSIIWCSLQILQIQEQKGLNITNVNLVEENNIYPTAIKIFLYSIFILLTSLLCAYIGAISLGIFHISFKTVLSHWEVFKKELFMPAIENGQIINPNIFNQIEMSVSSLLILSHNISNLLASLGMSLFMNAIFLNISAGFISGGGGEGSGGGGGEGSSSLLYNIIYHINNVNWSVLSIVLLIYTLKGPYDVHSIIQEIKDQLLLNENIWDNNDEKKLRFCERTKNLVERIEGIKIHRIDQQLFNLVFIAQMVLLWLLVAYSKYSKK